MISSPNFKVHEDLSQLLDHRGLLKIVAEECGLEYKRIHEIVRAKTDPRYTLGRTLEAWVEVSALLEASRIDIQKGGERQLNLRINDN